MSPINLKGRVHYLFICLFISVFACLTIVVQTAPVNNSLESVIEDARKTASEIAVNTNEAFRIFVSLDQAKLCSHLIR